MRRREFIVALGGAVAWPLIGRAQQPPVPVIGVLGSHAVAAPIIAALHKGLSEAGYVEGKNVAVEYRWTDGHTDRLGALALELVRRQVAVIVTVRSPAVFAAKAETSTIPIVFTVGTDPVSFGLVASLNRPGGNLTGVTTLFDEVAPKRLELLREVVPATTVFALLVNPTNPNAETQSKVVQEAAVSRGLQMHVLYASDESEIDAAFAGAAQRKAGALMIGGDPFLDSIGKHIAALAVGNGLPTTSFTRAFPLAGGLMSYGANLTKTFRLIGIAAGRILNGAKPGDLPVQQTTEVELVINLKTAKALGLEVPPSLLARADEVIE
jgi:putative ABC transport system substrate-binding protein